MVKIIYPTSDALFYIESRTPKDEAEWNAFEGQMLMLAESANLLMMPGRARDQKQWMADSKLLLDAGALAVKAAKTKNVESISALSDQLAVPLVAVDGTPPIWCVPPPDPAEPAGADAAGPPLG